MGETEEDLVAMASALRELDVDSIPLNFLNPIPGTPLAGARSLTPLWCFKILSLFRLANPAKEVRVAGGSEVNLGELRPLALFAANSLFMDGYLTTPGASAGDTHRFLEDLGFEVEECRQELFAAAG
jgi:biotin synthase